MTEIKKIAIASGMMLSASWILFLEGIEACIASNAQDSFHLDISKSSTYDLFNKINYEFVEQIYPVIIGAILGLLFILATKFFLSFREDLSVGKLYLLNYLFKEKEANIYIYIATYISFQNISLVCDQHLYS